MLAMVGLVVGCGEERPAGDAPGAPRVEPGAPAAEYPPAVCKDWGAAIERMNRCPAVGDLARKTFNEQYDRAASILAGAERRDPSLLARMCSVNLNNVASVLESSCAPEQPRTPAEEHAFLRREIDKTSAALEITRAAGGSPADVERLEREKQDLTLRFEALDAELSRGRLEGSKVSEECLKNPLATGCT